MEQIETIGATEQRELTRIRISVRNLVEFIFRSGDIDNRIGKGAQKEAMQEGSRMHRKIQGRMGMEYRAEVPLKLEVPQEQYVLALEGRADGIITNADGVTVDEIKCMYTDVTRFEEPIFVHKAQAMCYAYIYALQNGLDQISVQLTYCDLDTEEICRFEEAFSFFWLERWFQDMMEAYRKWTDFQFTWRKIRQTSIQTLEFPFPYREGQYKLVGDVYRTIHRKKILFIQAPTGVGKTMSCLYPAVRSVGEGISERIFYLTAKTITRTVAGEAFEILKKHGLRWKSLLLIAKEKLCVCDSMECNPAACARAKGHFDRVNDAVFELLEKEEIYDREMLLSYAERYQVCPYEMSLDLAVWVDGVICDYNYVFDPQVYLRRFFAEGVKGDYVFLIDEAHNLVERGREMYSAVLYKEDILRMKKLVKPYRKKLEKALERCNRLMLEWKRECETCRVLPSIGNFSLALLSVMGETENYLEELGDGELRKELLDFYFAVRSFLYISDLIDENYVIYTQHDEDGRFRVKLFCVNPAQNLQNCMDKGRSTVFFSATLLPVMYYRELLSGRSDDYAIYAQTPFAKEQKCLILGRDVSSRYTRRGPEEYGKIAEYIHAVVCSHTGNYMIFFPSYRMLDDILERYMELYGTDGVEILQQSPSMQEKEREDFLERFESENTGTLLGFCVMGGIFAEGIDLIGERLVGAVIVGTGLPQVSYEREILKQFYDRKKENGFDYAYRFPGMNKVLQSAGRVIRTKEDRGVILLLDERFCLPDYTGLFPREWEEYVVCDRRGVGKVLEVFWGR